LAERTKAAAVEDRAGLLGEFDVCRDWLALRAADCPINFLHLLKLVEAERAWQSIFSASCQRLLTPRWVWSNRVSAHGTVR